MPATVTLKLAIPPELGDRDAILADLRTRVTAEEKRAKLDRQKRKVRVLGRRAVRDQDWRDNPVTREPRRNLRPQLAARSVWARVESIQRMRAFVVAYAEARRRWTKDPTAKFPPGTYWLRRFANVAIET